MMKLLRADFYRIKKGNLGYISMIILFLIGILLAALGNDYATKELIESALSSGSLFMPIVITNILVITWGHEFGYRTVNNALISGVSRIKYFISKIVLTAILTILFMMIYATSISIGALIFKGDIAFGHAYHILLAQLPMYLAVSSLGVLLFNMINATHVAITIFLVATFIGDSIISLVVETYLKPLEFLLEYQFVSNIGNIANLSVLPANTIMTYIWSAVLFGLLFVGISYQIFKNREFK